MESLIYIFRNVARVDNDKYLVRDEIELIRKVLLQPVGENAIVHGLGKGSEAGKRRSSKWLHIRMKKA